MKRGLLVTACTAALVVGASLVLVYPAAAHRSHSEFDAIYRFGDDTFPASERSNLGFFTRAEETDQAADPAGIRHFRVLVDRDAVPGWFGNPD